jgi:hypothetical protein
MNRSLYKGEAPSLSYMEKQLKNYAALGMSVVAKLAMKTKWYNTNYTMPL